MTRIAWRPRHDSGLLGLEGQHQAERHGGGHVDPQDLGGQDRQRRPHRDGRQDHESLTDVGGQRPRDELGQVVEDSAAFFDRGLDGGEVVVGEHHVGRVLGDLGTTATHRHTDAGLP